MAVCRNDGHKDLRRSDNAALGMDGKLLHRAVNRSVQCLQTELLCGLQELFMEA